ncbi:DUF2335 domain-containing protein [Acinetobacter indicus]|nr:DUF2335 domain-containing protein [Acinetobacter indicus]
MTNENPAHSPTELTDDSEKDSLDSEIILKEGKVERIVEHAVENAVERAVIQIRQESYRGPLPKPEHLKAYDEICPGAAKDILNEFKENGRHVRECEKRGLNASIWKVTRGQIFATILALVCLSLAFICVSQYQANGVAIAFIVLTGTLVLPFLGFNPKSEKR